MKNVYATDIITLKKIMLEKGINTIGELSEKTQISRNTLGKVLSGRLQPSSETMFRLVSVLNISPELAGVIFFSQHLPVA